MFRTVNQILFYFSGCFYYLSSTLNPLLYNVMSVKYRQVTIEHYSAQSCHNESSSNPFYQIMDNLVRLSAPLSRALRTLMTVRQCWSSPRCSTPRPPTCWPRATSTWRTCWTAGATAGPVWAWGLTPASWALATPPGQERSGAAASATPPTCYSSPSLAIRGSSMVRSPGGNDSLETRYLYYRSSFSQNKPFSADECQWQRRKDDLSKVCHLSNETHVFAVLANKKSANKAMTFSWESLLT